MHGPYCRVKCTSCDVLHGRKKRQLWHRVQQMEVETRAAHLHLVQVRRDVLLAEAAYVAVLVRLPVAGVSSGRKSPDQEQPRVAQSASALYTGTESESSGRTHRHSLGSCPSGCSATFAK